MMEILGSENYQAVFTGRPGNRQVEENVKRDGRKRR
jgi:hypothetical protein